MIRSIRFVSREGKAFASDRLDSTLEKIEGGQWRQAGLILAGAVRRAFRSSLAVLIVAMVAVAPGIPKDADLYALKPSTSLHLYRPKGDVVGVRGAIVGDRLKLAEMPRYTAAASWRWKTAGFISASWN
jgi:hypothetical protein